MAGPRLGDARCPHGLARRLRGAHPAEFTLRRRDVHSRQFHLLGHIHADHATENSGTARRLSIVSLSPMQENIAVGGLSDTTLKEEKGARLTMPTGGREDTQAFGRATTRSLCR